MVPANRVVKHVSDMEIDEISLVDRPANQHALVTIAKRRAPEEDVVPDFDELYDSSGNVVDPTELAFGDTVFDAEGVEYVLEPDEAPELAEAGVSKAFDGKDQGASSGYSLLDELSKAVTDSERDQVIAKAFEQNKELSKRLEQAEELAKSERTLRLEREYIAKAAEYNVPIEPEKLGPVLMRAAENLSYEDCTVLHKALTSAGEMLFQEAGYQGQADNVDPMTQIENYIDQSVAKSEGGISKAEATEAFFANNPQAYDEYRFGLSR